MRVLYDASVVESEDKVVVRVATRDDVPGMMRLLRTELPHSLDLATSGENDPRYLEAFERVSADQNQLLIVATMKERVVGATQMTMIPYVAYGGGWIGHIEAFAVDPFVRRQGVGARLVAFAVDAARARGCFRLQLTSNKRRSEAHRFYERVGFVASHEGFKMML